MTQFRHAITYFSEKIDNSSVNIFFFCEIRRIFFSLIEIIQITYESCSPMMITVFDVIFHLPDVNGISSDFFYFRVYKMQMWSFRQNKMELLELCETISILNSCEWLKSNLFSGSRAMHLLCVSEWVNVCGCVASVNIQLLRLPKCNIIGA